MSRLSQLFRRPTPRLSGQWRKARPSAVWQPTLLMLEDRCVPSAVSSITASFNGTAIQAGSTLWFDAAVTASGLPKSAPVTLHVVNGSIDFTAGGTPYHVAVPNAEIVFTPGAKYTSITYVPSDNDWDVSAPSAGTGDVFMGGVALPLPNGLPGGIKNVTWSAAFWADTAGVTVNWKWAAAAYQSFSTDYNALGVKPVDNKDLSVYHNGDQSGTPEAYKSFVTAGAMGGGGSNYTGNFTGGKSVKPTFGDGMSDYPFPSSNPLTSVAFNESTVLRAANLDTVNGFFQVWYNDEHALALGVSQVIVKTASGTTTTNYPVAALTSNPGVALNPAVGSTATAGDQAGTDASGRPMAPSLYITDITNDLTNRSGDWQSGGTAIAPSAVFGSWKSFTRTVDKTTSTPTVTLATTADPAKNDWNLGPGSDAPPAGLRNEGYGAEMRWNLSDLRSQGLLIPGHTYRFYVMVHDGDQNKSGGDSGQASFNYYYPGPVNPPAARTASLSGSLYLDFNNNGMQDAGEDGISGVMIALSGTDVNGNAVLLTTTTDNNGFYSFTNLAAGRYQLQKPPAPSGWIDTGASAGLVNGVTDGTVVDRSTIGSITLGATDNAIGYNFGELPFA